MTGLVTTPLSPMLLVDLTLRVELAEALDVVEVGALDETLAGTEAADDADAGRDADEDGADDDADDGEEDDEEEPAPEDEAT